MGGGRGVAKNKRQHETWPLVIFISSVPCPERFIDIVKISLTLAAFLLVVYGRMYVGNVKMYCGWPGLTCQYTREIFAQ
jgi:hypothetical protein